MPKRASIACGSFAFRIACSFLTSWSLVIIRDHSRGATRRSGQGANKRARTCAALLSRSTVLREPPEMSCMDQATRPNRVSTSGGQRVILNKSSTTTCRGAEFGIVGRKPAFRGSSSSPTQGCQLEPCPSLLRRCVCRRRLFQRPSCRSGLWCSRRRGPVRSGWRRGMRSTRGRRGVDGLGGADEGEARTPRPASAGGRIPPAAPINPPPSPTPLLVRRHHL